jgi:hypothetical protein
MMKSKKKSIFYGVAVLAIAAVAAINVNLNSQQGKELSSLALENLEALSSSENSATCTFGYVNKNQPENILECRGNGTLCCTMN